MDPTIKIGDWEYSKDKAGSVYLYHWCPTRKGWRGAFRSPISSTRMGGIKSPIVCRCCFMKAPPEVDGFVNLLDWDYV